MKFPFDDGKVRKAEVRRQTLVTSQDPFSGLWWEANILHETTSTTSPPDHTSKDVCCAPEKLASSNSIKRIGKVPGKWGAMEMGVSK